MIQSPPYIIEVTDGSARGVPIDQKRYEGYCIDLIEEIAKFIGFKYDFEIVPDGQHGTYIEKTKTWNGLIKRLLDRVSKIFYVCKTLLKQRIVQNLFVIFLTN